MLVRKIPSVPCGVDDCRAAMKLHESLIGRRRVDTAQCGRQQVHGLAILPTCKGDLRLHAPEETHPFKRAVIDHQCERLVDSSFCCIEILGFDMHVGQIVENPCLKNTALHFLGELAGGIERACCTLIGAQLGQGIGHIIMSREIQGRVLVTLQRVLKILYCTLKLLGVIVDGGHRLQRD